MAPLKNRIPAYSRMAGYFHISKDTNTHDLEFNGIQFCAWPGKVLWNSHWV
jgi:hypothetical protein